jgi:hypothetical protein
LSKKSVATLCNKTVGRNQYFEIKKSDGPWDLILDYETTKEIQGFHRKVKLASDTDK